MTPHVLPQTDLPGQLQLQPLRGDPPPPDRRTRIARGRATSKRVPRTVRAAGAGDGRVQDPPRGRVSGGLGRGAPPGSTPEHQPFSDRGEPVYARERDRASSSRRASRGRRPPRRRTEYKRDSDLVVVSDPHPWHPSVYSLAVADFDKAWRAARGRRLPWSACVYPARP